MGVFPAEQSESSERGTSDVVRVEFSNHNQTLFYDDYYLKVLAYHQEYLI